MEVKKLDLSVVDVYDNTGNKYWIIFESGNINRPLLVLPNYQMKMLFEEIQRLMKEELTTSKETDNE